MGFQRHSGTITSEDTPVVAERDQAMTREPKGRSDICMGRPDATRGETDVFRQAREMRGEWRRQRYSRLKWN